MASVETLKRVSDFVWELPISFKQGMRVPGRIYATQKIVQALDQGVFNQLANVASLPGVESHVCAMPDAHWGYGFPIGGVAAMRLDDGVVSPGGIGFDINCGMRLIKTNLTASEVKPHIEKLVNGLYSRVPVGVGTKGLLRLSEEDFRRLLIKGARWCVSEGYGRKDDLERTEAGGCYPDADPEAVSERAIERGLRQVGTLGSGNHYLEIQTLKKEHLFNEDVAERLGLFPNQVVVMYHCGSRGFGHQVASDYLEQFLSVMGPRYKIKVPDRELSCAPINSPHAQAYLAAMRCAINMAFANRQMIQHQVREVFEFVFGRSSYDLGMDQIYDISHNTAKVEEQVVKGVRKKLLVHRKGATRSYGPGFDELPPDLKDVGQPVIIGGSMETGSYLLVGLSSSSEAFHTTAHGAGRAMSRTKAKKMFHGRTLQDKMINRGIYIRAASLSGLAEEAGGAYKDVDDVVAAAEKSGLSRRVARFVPIGNIKG
ncbi:RNA-splicing ligase RtcB [bacterium F11]|nr:RNA-splicing ligase RtcB [bacterium F11]